MIRLIATDLDGTLLDSGKRLPKEFFDLVHELHRRDVRMVIASGRQYYNLLKIFEPVADELTFICENGAIVFEGRKLSYACPIDLELQQKALETVRRLPDVHPIFCGVDSAYLDSDNAEFQRNAALYYERRTQVADIGATSRDDQICKIAVFDARGGEANSWPVIREMNDEFMVTLAGAQWIDFMKPGVNKGEAIKELQRRWQLTPENCMAFGDYLNDCEMMRECHWSYAMANAHPELAACCNYQTGLSNDENGVVATIRRHFDF